MKEGPLWRARLVIQPGDETEDVLMIAVQHCLTDGNTNMILARDVMTTINASRTGQNLEVPVRPIIPAIMDQMWSFKHSLFIAYTFVKKVCDTVFIDYDKKLTFEGVYRAPTTKESKVKTLRGDLTEDQTRKLIQNCKRNGVTVHCCIYAALHAAYLKMAQNMSSKKIESAPMVGADYVNTRRYYDKSHFEDPGCHVSMIENELLIKYTHITTEKGFWELAHQVSDNLKYRLNVEVIKSTPLFRYIREKQYTNQHFMTSNMGNLKDLLPANPGSGPLEITSLLRSVSMQYCWSPFLVAMHTFRGRFMYSVDYFTNKVEDDVAHQYFAIFSLFVNNIADVGSVE